MLRQRRRYRQNRSARKRYVRQVQARAGQYVAVQLETGEVGAKRRRSNIL